MDTEGFRRQRKTIKTRKMNQTKTKTKTKKKRGLRMLKANISSFWKKPIN